MSSSPLPRLTDLGRSLAADSNGAYYRRLRDHLQEETSQARATLDKGVGGGEARSLEAEIDALDSAQRIIEVVWGVLHVDAVAATGVAQ